MLILEWLQDPEHINWEINGTSLFIAAVMAVITNGWNEIKDHRV